MDWLVSFLKSVLKEPSVRALIIGLAVNGLLYLVGLIPNPPTWLSDALVAFVQQVALLFEALLAGWAASRIKDAVKTMLR